MQLEAKAQVYLEDIVVDDSAMPTVVPVMGDMHDPNLPVIEVEMYEPMEHEQDHGHEHEHIHVQEGEDPEMEVSEPNDDIVIEDLGDIPGLANALDPEKEQLLEVVEDSEEPKKQDENDARKSKKIDQWDWEARGHEGFIEWIQDRFKSVPKHSGYDSSGLERAVSYLERLDNEISKAMRLDLDGKLDADKIEDIRSKIDDGIERLYERLDKIKKNKKKKKKADLSDQALVKEAQKITGVKGIFVTVPLITSTIARICINGYVSAGHDLEDMFQKLAKKYKLNDREKLETIQLLSDMGFPIRTDRGLVDEEFDPTSSDNMDFSAQYKA